MKDKWDRLENEDYVDRVLLPESLIKLYSDFFLISKSEAEARINNTPLPPEDDYFSD